MRNAWVNLNSKWIENIEAERFWRDGVKYEDKEDNHLCGHR
jgi:hypothetical protein